MNNFPIFPKNFTFGAASSAYQIEGERKEIPRGKCIWDMLSAQPGKIADNSNASHACMHICHWQKDVSLMHELGLQAYRFSIGWTRILPNGIGRINQKGLDFYDNLLDALLEKKIQPWLTLFHWDFPYELFCKGGWLNRDSSDWFAEFVQIIVEKFSDRIKHWVTMNEIQIFITYGHDQAIHAPGLKYGIFEQFLATHNALLAHGKAVQIIRQNSKTKNPQIGTCTFPGPLSIPDEHTSECIEVARLATFDIRNEKTINFSGIWVNDALMFGKYPKKGLKILANKIPKFPQQDFKIIAQELDFFGINIYSAERVKAAPKNAKKKWQFVKKPNNQKHNTLNWKIEASALYWGPKFFYQRYKKPIVLLENGLANNDWLQSDGKICDYQRIDYHKTHLENLKKAIDENTPVTAYFAWTLMDNFEWMSGYTERFGLIYVDFETQKRIIKESGYWYRDLIKSQRK